MNVIKEISMANNRIIYKLYTTETDSITQYGLMISTTLFGDKESANVDNITPNKEMAEKMFYTFIDNTVLPSTMKEIIEEYINEELATYC